MGCNFVGFHFNAVHFLVVYPHWVSLWCIKMQIETFVSFIVLCSHTDKQYDNMNEHTNGIEMTIKIFEAVQNDVTKALTKNFNCIKLCIYQNAWRKVLPFRTLFRTKCHIILDTRFPNDIGTNKICASRSGIR